MQNINYTNSPFTIMEGYRKNPTASLDAFVDYGKDVAKGAGYGFLYGLANYIYKAAEATTSSGACFLCTPSLDKEWAITMLKQSAVIAGAAAAAGPVAYQAVRTLNEGSRVLSRIFGLKVAIVLPEEWATILSTAAITALATDKLGPHFHGHKVDKSTLPHAFFNGMIIPDFIKNMNKNTFIGPVNKVFKSL